MENKPGKQQIDPELAESLLDLAREKGRVGEKVGLLQTDGGYVFYKPEEPQKKTKVEEK